MSLPSSPRYGWRGRLVAACTMAAMVVSTTTACGDGGAPPPVGQADMGQQPGDAGGGPGSDLGGGQQDGGGVDFPDLGRDDAGGVILPPGAVELQPLEGGGERGVATTNELGKVFLVAPQADVRIALELRDDEDDPVGAGLRVAALIDEARKAHVFLFDPSGAHTPYVFTHQIEDGPAQLQVAPPEDGSLVTEAESVAADPFGAGSFSLAEISITAAIKGALRVVFFAVLGTALLSVCQRVGGSTKFCNRLKLAYDTLTGGVGAKLFKLYKLLQVGLKPASRFVMKELRDQGVSYLTDHFCRGGGQEAGAFMLRWTKAASGDPMMATGDELGWYREILWKINYLLYALEHDPPADADTAAIYERLGLITAHVLAIGRMVTPDTVDVYPFTVLGEKGAEGLLMKFLQETGNDLYKQATGDDFPSSLQAAVEGDLKKFLTTWAQDSVELELQAALDDAYEQDETNQVIEDLIGCGVAFVSEFSVTLLKHDEATGMMVEEEASFDPLALAKNLGAGASALLDELYQAHWQGSTPPAGCSVDLHEPNGTWEMAAAQPIAAQANSTSYVRDLTLCGPPVGAGAETDWYAFSVGAINLAVTVELLGAQGLDPYWEGEEVCLESFRYDSQHELLGWDPVPHGQKDCGVMGVDSGPILRFSDSRTTGMVGDDFDYIMIKVDPQSPSMTAPPLDYAVRFTR